MQEANLCGKGGLGNELSILPFGLGRTEGVSNQQIAWSAHIMMHISMKHVAYLGSWRLKTTAYFRARLGWMGRWVGKVRGRGEKEEGH